MQLDGELVKFV